MLIRGKAWVFGHNVNTDLIFPKIWFRPTYEPGEMASHLMAGIDEEFPKKLARGDFIVGGANLGCGSSREEAAGAMKEAGIGAVIADSFGRLFTRNCINAGLPAIASSGVHEHVSTGDELELDLDGGQLRNLRTGYLAQLPRMAPESLQLIRDGGIVAYTARILAERRAASATRDPEGRSAPDESSQAH
jgi:3-isopropylmalate/(R)-2-methylmalate dehydratase small subunit